MRLLFTLAGGSGHLEPLVPLARAAQARGHTVAFGGGEPGSARIPPNTAYVHRFDRPGTYRYHCTPHPFMVGVVVVR